MDTAERSSSRGRLHAAVYAVAAAALALKLYVSWVSHGTEDISSWQFFWRILKQEGGSKLLTYPQFNHPPLVVHLLQGIIWLRRTTGMPMPFSIRLPGILADVGSILLLVRILASETDRRTLQLCLTAAAPISIMVSGYHGNTDPVMVFFLLLSLRWVDRPGRLCLSGAALGLSLGIKVVPVVFLPAIFLRLKSAGRRLAFFGSMLAVVIASWMPYIARDPLTIVRKLFTYRSLPLHWGLSRILHALPAPFDKVASSFDAYGVVFLLAGLLAITVWMHRLEPKPSLFRQVGVLTFTFLSLTPGFGTQYLAWLVPWTAVVGPLAAAVFHAISGAYLLLVYTGSFGMLDGMEFEFGSEPAIIVVPQVLCWISVIVLGCMQARALVDRAKAAPGGTTS